MYSRCAVLGCPNKAGHRFPKNEVVRKKWIEVMKLDHQRNIGWHLSSGSAICSHHFRPSDYDLKYDSNGVQEYRRLKNHAIPSIFPWPVCKKPTFDASQLTKRGGVQQFKRLKNHAIPSIFPSPIYKESTFDASQVTKRGGVQQFKTLKNHAIPSILPSPIYKEPTFHARQVTKKDGVQPKEPTFDASQVTKTYSRKERPLAFVPEIAFMDSTTCDITEIDPLQTEVEIKIEPSGDNYESLPYIIHENMSFDVDIINNIDQCLNTTLLPNHEEVDSNEIGIKSEIPTESDSNELIIKSEITGETDSNENIIKSEITTESNWNEITIKSEITIETDSVYI